MKQCLQPNLVCNFSVLPAFSSHFRQIELTSDAFLVLCPEKDPRGSIVEDSRKDPRGSFEVKVDSFLEAVPW